MHRLLMRRARAYARDSLGYALIAVAEVPIGLMLSRRRTAPSPLLVAVLSSVPPVGATVWAAIKESGAGSATWGKRAEGLWVVSANGEPGIGQMLARNAVKILAPWTLGHIVGFGAASGGFEEKPGTMAALGLLIPLTTSTALLAAAGSGAALHDRVAGTRVVGN